jgi:uncharacterized membrane protein
MSKYDLAAIAATLFVFQLVAYVAISYVDGYRFPLLSLAVHFGLAAFSISVSFISIVAIRVVENENEH